MNYSYNGPETWDRQVGATSTVWSRSANSAPTAYTVGNLITINIDSGYVLPSQTVVFVGNENNQATTINLAQITSIGLGLNEVMSTGDYQSLIMLHEFKHVLGAPQETPAQVVPYNRSIWDECLR